jgi:hypothetical protein
MNTVVNVTCYFSIKNSFDHQDKMCFLLEQSNTNVTIDEIYYRSIYETTLKYLCETIVAVSVRLVDETRTNQTVRHSSFSCQSPQTRLIQYTSVNLRSDEHVSYSDADLIDDLISVYMTIGNVYPVWYEKETGRLNWPLRSRIDLSITIGTRVGRAKGKDQRMTNRSMTSVFNMKNEYLVFLDMKRTFSTDKFYLQSDVLLTYHETQIVFHQFIKTKGKKQQQSFRYVSCLISFEIELSTLIGLAFVLLRFERVHANKSRITRQDSET